MSVELTTALKAPLATPDANLGYLFRLAYQAFRGMLDDELRELGLSTQEYGILSVFESRPDLSTSDVARIAQVTRQTMHAATLRLEADGLLERRAKNRRVIRLALTDRGRGVLDAATDRVRAVEARAFAGPARDDEQTVRRWLARLAASPAPQAEPKEPS